MQDFTRNAHRTFEEAVAAQNANAEINRIADELYELRKQRAADAAPKAGPYDWANDLTSF
jgi:hypothetical protein